MVAAGLLTGLAVADEVQGRRAVAEEARAQDEREQEAVELLLLDDWSGTSSYERETGTLAYRVDLSVRNDGPRAVQLIDIGLPGVQLAAPVALEAGQERPLSLDGRYVCGVREPAPVAVAFEVRTQAGPRYVDLPIPSGMFDTDPLADECDQAEAAASGS